MSSFSKKEMASAFLLTLSDPFSGPAKHLESREGVWPAFDHEVLRLIRLREALGPENDRRQEFWAPLRNSPNTGDRSISQLESQLQREFGVALRSQLVELLSGPLREIERELFPDRLLDFDRFFFRLKEPISEREWYRYQFAEVFTKFIELRRDVYR